jgi:hypothetical protein
MGTPEVLGREYDDMTSTGLIKEKAVEVGGCRKGAEDDK